ncbi:MAG: c-type cytochrome [Deltaproteobacteria bacterium]|nr:c-type cytochrome [Deltaproteobacteria bacterium]
MKSTPKTRRAALLAAPFLLLGNACRDLQPIEAPTAVEAMAAPDRAKVELGQRLFFDRQLSADGSTACATCHVPVEGGDDDRAVSLGVGGQAGKRNSPTVLNAGFKAHLFWDGRATTLEEQALMPLRAKDEMGADDAAVLAYLGRDASYPGEFQAAFGDAAISMERLASAVATYQRQLVTPSRVDAFLLGDEGALNAQEQRGLSFFRGNCTFCHDGPGVGGQRLEKLGFATEWPAERTHDLGLEERTQDEGDRLVFAVPQLRNVARTAPYFHDGSVATLEEAIQLMGRHQLGEELTEDQIADLVAMLEALSADPEPRLLQDPNGSR